MYTPICIDTYPKVSCKVVYVVYLQCTLLCIDTYPKVSCKVVYVVYLQCTLLYA